MGGEKLLGISPAYSCKWFVSILPTKENKMSLPGQHFKYNKYYLLNHRFGTCYFQ